MLECRKLVLISKQTLLMSSEPSHTDILIYDIYLPNL